VLIRHAATAPDQDRPNRLWPLTAAGRRDAERLVGALPPVAAVYASVEHKAVATAEPLAAAYGLAVRTNEDLGELRRPWSGGRTVYEVAVGRCFAHPDAPAAPGWETAVAALARFTAAVEGICGAHADGGGAVAIATHGLVLSLYRARLLGRPIADFQVWQALAMPAWAVADPAAGRLLKDFAPL